MSLPRVGSRLTAASLVAGILVGGAMAVGWYDPGSGEVEQRDDACTSPPCGPESLPDLEQLPQAVPLLLLLAAAFAGLLCLLLAVRSRSRRSFGTGVLGLLGPLIIFAGTEVVPHGLNPCFVSEIDGLCSDSAEFGVDWAGRVHFLAHAVVGQAPLTVLYWRALRRWRPEVVAVSRVPGGEPSRVVQSAGARAR